jgi:hypothetical protein
MYKQAKKALWPSSIPSRKSRRKSWVNFEHEDTPIDAPRTALERPKVTGALLPMPFEGHEPRHVLGDMVQKEYRV